MDNEPPQLDYAAPRAKLGWYQYRRSPVDLALFLFVLAIIVFLIKNFSRD